MGLFSKLKEILDDGKYNRELYRSGKADRNEIRETAIGWKPDGGYIPDPGNKKDLGIDKVTGQTIRDTPSGTDEYYRVIRKIK